MRQLVQALALDLETSAVLGEFTDNIACDTLPEQPDTCIAILERIGDNPSQFYEVSSRAIQFLIRSTSYASAQDLAWTVFDRYQVENGIGQLGTEKVIYTPTCTPIKLDKDAEGRTVFSFNMNVITQH